VAEVEQDAAALRLAEVRLDLAALVEDPELLGQHVRVDVARAHAPEQLLVPRSRPTAGWPAAASSTRFRRRRSSTIPGPVELPR
jgi:hypothetical protein